MEMRILRLKSSKAKKYFVEMTTDCQTPQYGKVPLCTHTKKICAFSCIFALFMNPRDNGVRISEHERHLQKKYT